MCELLIEFQAALRLDPPNPEARYGKAVALEATEDREHAVESYRLVLRHDPDHAGSLLGLALSTPR